MPMPTFPPAVNVPIIGQPFTVVGWRPTADIVCACPAKTPITMVGLGAIAMCPACHRTFSLAAMAVEPQSGQVGVQIAQVIVRHSGNGNGEAAPA